MTTVVKTLKLHKIWKTVVIKHIRINLKVINTGVKNAISKNINEKGLKQHQKMKHNSSQYEKVGNIFKCGTCEKAEFF